MATVAAAEDRRTHLLRNVHTGPLALLAVLGFGVAKLVGGETIQSRDLLIGVAVFAGPWLLSFLVSPTSIGFGDVKFAAALGLYLGRLGPSTALAGLLAACAIGGATALGTLIRGRTAEPFPFGPSLLAGAAVAVVLEVASLGVLVSG